MRTALAAVALVALPAVAAEPVPDTLRAELKLAPFYQRHADGVVRGSVAAAWATRGADRMKLPTVPASEARPAEGTVALVRGGAGAFVLFPEAPAAVADVVPFGRVASGASVLRAILAGGAAVDVRRVIRTE